MRSRSDLTAIRDAGYGGTATDAEKTSGRLAALALTALDRQDAILALRDSVPRQPAEMAGFETQVTQSALEALAWDYQLDLLEQTAAPAIAQDPLPSGTA